MSAAYYNTGGRYEPRAWDTWIPILAWSAPRFLHPPVARYQNERRRECETSQPRPSMVCLKLGTISQGSIELTPDSIQDALRMFLQPIKNDDPRLDFFTMYKRETMEYDTDSMQKHNEDLNTTLIFVRFCVPSIDAQR